jgi:hypothetical protein
MTATQILMSASGPADIDVGAGNPSVSAESLNIALLFRPSKLG